MSEDNKTTGQSDRQVSRLGFGELMPKDTLMLRRIVGETTNEDIDGYEFYVGVQIAPIIKSKLTGKFFSLNWNDLIDLAIQAGIDEPD